MVLHVMVLPVMVRPGAGADEDPVEVGAGDAAAGQQVADRGGQDLGVGAGVRARVGAEDLARTGDEGGGGDGGGVQAQEEHPTSVVPAPGGASRLSRAAGARPPSAGRSP